MKQELMKVINQRQLAPRIYELTLKGELVNEMNSSRAVSACSSASC